MISADAHGPTPEPLPNNTPVSAQPAKGPRDTWKYVAIFTFFLIGFTALLVRLFIVQISKASAYQERARRQYEAPIELKPQRGAIYDRNRSLIASTVKSMSYAADPRQVRTPGVLLDGLALLSTDSTDIAIWSQRLADKRRSFVWLARGLGSSVILDTIREPGLIKIPEPRRNYVYGSHAAQLIGCTNVDNQGLSGLELAFDSLLRGKPGKKTMFRDGRGNLRPGVEIGEEPALNGRSIVTTLDIELQSIVEHELALGAFNSGAVSGSVIAMKPSTGEVLAMASYPSYNPHKVKQASPEAMRLRAIADMYEPGSTFKLVTAAAALEEGIVDSASTVDGRNGLLKVSDVEIKDAHPLGRVSFRTAMNESSNVVFAELAQRISDDKFYKYARDFGFGITLGFDAPGEVPGKMKKPKEFDGSTKLYMSFGYQLAATALQLASAYSAIANDGVLMKPYVISSIESAAGDVLEKERPRAIRTVVSAVTAQKLRSLLRSVVDSGTGKEARIDGLSVAGKTGTAQQLVEGAYSRQEYTASFAGFFPADKPELVIVVMLDRPKTDIYGGKTAAPIFRKIAQRWITHRGLTFKAKGAPAPQDQSVVYVPDVRGIDANDARSNLANLQLEADGPSIGPVVAQDPGPGTPVPPGSKVRISTITERSLDSLRAPQKVVVTGLSVRRALALLHAHGAKVRVIGSGVVSKQTWTDSSPPVCTIECR